MKKKGQNGTSCRKKPSKKTTAGQRQRRGGGSQTYRCSRGEGSELKVAYTNLNWLTLAVTELNTYLRKSAMGGIEWEESK